MLFRRRPNGAAGGGIRSEMLLQDDRMRRALHRRAQALRTSLTGWVARFAATLSTAGILLATLFFAASLTPSLVPRTWAMQGVLSGVSIAAGYGLGVFGRWLWRYLGLPVPRARTQELVVVVATAISVTIALLFLRQAAGWQNSIRVLMELEPVDSAHPFRVGATATAVALGLLAVGRLFGLVFRAIAHWLGDHVPGRAANVVGAIAAVAIFWLVIDGVLLDAAIRAVDSSFRQVDALVEPDVQQPTGPLRTGSTESLADWEGLGRRGREFVASGPGAEEIARFLGDDAPESVLEPVRVYVGLNSAETIEERARLALEELQRVGAFERSVLTLAVPTGSGWVDPDAIGTLEHLHRGDVATVAVQYSYLPSWLSLLTEAEYGDATARAVFTEIYEHWTDLPSGSRPALYLHGVSLGALNSQRSADFYDIIPDPFAGALWVGPPFRSERWRTLTEERVPGSPAWLPRFRDGSMVRFMNQRGTPHEPGARWGPVRILYLQYASDPITFFEQEALYRPPEWMAPPRGPDVSPELRWYPVVTVLQLAVDIVAAGAAPEGYGHVFAPRHYVEAWLEVTDPPGWTRPEVERLKAWVEERGEADDEAATAPEP